MVLFFPRVSLLMSLRMLRWSRAHSETMLTLSVRTVSTKKRQASLTTYHTGEHDDSECLDALYCVQMMGQTPESLESSFLAASGESSQPISVVSKNGESHADSTSVTTTPKSSITLHTQVSPGGNWNKLLLRDKDN